MTLKETLGNVIDWSKALASRVTKALVRGVTWAAGFPATFVLPLIIATLGILAAVFMRKDVTVTTGMISRLFGGPDPEDRVARANEVPSNRKEPVGVADDQGFVQREVTEIKTSANPFRDKTLLKIADPTNPTKTKKIKLPSGVRDTDVDKVVQIAPKVFEVIVQARPQGRVTDEDLTYLD